MAILSIVNRRKEQKKTEQIKNKNKNFSNAYELKEKKQLIYYKKKKTFMLDRDKHVNNLPSTHM